MDSNTYKKGSAGGKATAIIEKEQARQRIDEYNKNPNSCLCCNKPILASYDQKLRDVKIKKFCSLSCAAKYNNVGKVHNPTGINNSKSIISNLSNNQIIEAFNSSNNLTEFSLKLGYKSRINKNQENVQNKLAELNLDINDLIADKNDVNSDTKGSLFDRRSNWQNARSTIQKEARKIYQNSDKPKQCIVCGYDKHYEVAHVKAVSDFSDDALISEINDEENLIALCPNHHWEYDNDGLDISLYL